MTQILGVVTHDYVLMATDRRLSFLDGPRAGRVADDDTCKLVCLCNAAGIAYTGLAAIGGKPTHEWIALRLAERGCTSAVQAGQVLAECAASELPRTRYSGEQTFLIAGWDWMPGESRLRPHLGLVSNKYDASGGVRTRPGREFSHFVNWLSDDRKWTAKVAGSDMSDAQVRHQRRLYNRLANHEVSSRTVLGEMARSISETAAAVRTVGNRVLCMCVPRSAVEGSLSGNGSTLLATNDDVSSASFSYYDPEYSELRQYGPTTVCGQTAFTDVVTETDPSRDYQSVQVKILRMPSEP